MSQSHTVAGTPPLSGNTGTRSCCRSWLGLGLDARVTQTWFFLDVRLCCRRWREFSGNIPSVVERRLVVARLPVTEIVLGVVQDLAGLAAVAILALRITGGHGGVVQQRKETSAVLGQDDLSLGALNHGSEFGVVCFLDLLSRLEAVLAKLVAQAS